MPDSQQNTPTPPEIVARAKFPVDALAAFIGQELERWGFVVDVDFDNVHVKAGEDIFLVVVEEPSR